MGKKPNIWKIVSALGMLIGLAGTAMQGYASDKELEAHIDEAVEKKLAESKRTEGQ